MKNHEIFLKYPSNNMFNIPDLKKQGFKKLPENIIPHAYGMKPKYPALIHCFIDDKRFESTWTYPEKAVQYLKSEKIWAVCAPDFSIYADFPHALQIYQIWRSRVLNLFWQDHGIRVIPTIMFSNENSLLYSFVGIPKKQIVAISIPSRGTEQEFDNFIKGYFHMKKEIDPIMIICFGKIYDFMQDDIEKIVFSKGHFNQKKYHEVEK